MSGRDLYLKLIEAFAKTATQEGFAYLKSADAFQKRSEEFRMRYQLSHSVHGRFLTVWRIARVRSKSLEKFLASEVGLPRIKDGSTFEWMNLSKPSFGPGSITVGSTQTILDLDPIMQKVINCKTQKEALNIFASDFRNRILPRFNKFVDLDGALAVLTDPEDQELNGFPKAWHFINVLALQYLTGHYHQIQTSLPEYQARLDSTPVRDVRYCEFVVLKEFLMTKLEQSIRPIP